MGQLGFFDADRRLAALVLGIFSDQSRVEFTSFSELPSLEELSCSIDFRWLWLGCRWSWQAIRRENHGKCDANPDRFHLELRDAGCRVTPKPYQKRSLWANCTRPERSLPRDLENSRNAAVMTAQTVWLPKSSRPVSQQPSRKNPVVGFIEQISSRSPSTLRGALRRPPPPPPSSLRMPASITAVVPRLRCLCVGGARSDQAGRAATSVLVGRPTAIGSLAGKVSSSA